MANTLLMHQAIGICALVGVPDPRGISGEGVKAFLVLQVAARTKPAAEELTRS